MSLISEFKRGDRVYKVDAQPMDIAYGRYGTIHTQRGMIGVLWDGVDRIIQYPWEWGGFIPEPKTRLLSLILNILAIAPQYLWRDYWHNYSIIGNRREAFREAFWFHASGTHRRICGYTSL